MPVKTKYTGPWSDVERKPGLKTGAWRYQRPVIREEKCCHCALCALYCPTGCRIDKQWYFTADFDYCKGCGICARSCPRAAIAMVAEG